MADLLVSTGLTQIETALQSTIRLAMQRRFTKASESAMATFGGPARAHGDLVYRSDTSSVWQWDKFSTASVSSSVVAASPVTPAGRWLLTSSTDSTGYLQAVELYEGAATDSEILTRYGGRKPVVVIVWDGEDNTPISATPGALYDYRPRFLLWILSSNLRGEHQTAIGSQIAAEAALDPGTNKIMGDLKAALAGSDLGQTGVKWCEIGRGERVFTSLADRIMIYQLRVEVRATLHNVDPDGADVAVSEFAVTRGLQQSDGTYQQFGDTDIISAT